MRRQLSHLSLSSTSDKYSEIAVLLKIDQRSDTKNSGVIKTLRSRGAGVVSYALRAYKVFMEGGLVQTSEAVHLIRNCKF